jgi:2-isopropylmalate synthase
MRRAPNASKPIREEDPPVTADDEQTAAPPDPDKRVLIFDTTLRDGEQAPGITLNTREKVEIGQQLARLGVDVIEAGFPIASPGDFEGVRAVAQEVPGVVVAGLARADERDVTAAGEAVGAAERGRIHTFIATSDIHLTYKLRMSRDQVLAAATDAVRLARSIVDDVESSHENSTSSGRRSPRGPPRSTSPTRSATRCRPSSSASCSTSTSAAPRCAA